MKTTNLIIGLVAAAAAGVAIGMLIAPEKGVDLQKRIRDGAQDWLDEISRLVNSRRKLVTDGVQPEAAQSEHQRAVHGLTNN